VLDLEKRVLVDPADGSEEMLTASEFDLLKVPADVHAGRQGRRVVSAFIGTAFVQDDAEAPRAQWRSRSFLQWAATRSSRGSSPA
jgi:hypothetical protein